VGYGGCPFAPSGFVRNVTDEFDFVRGTLSGHRTMTVHYARVGETTVEVPTQVKDAKTVTNATGKANVTDETGDD
jgi:hypothetical protein